jgi:hypothetical protein
MLQMLSYLKFAIGIPLQKAGQPLLFARGIPLQKAGQPLLLARGQSLLVDPGLIQTLLFQVKKKR